MRAKNDKTLSVLLVEWDPHSLHLIRKSLEENSRFKARVDQATSASQAIDKVQKNSYDLLLTDLENEAADFTLLEEMKRLKIELPFILLTSIKDDGLARKATQYGAARVIVKNESQFHELSDKIMDFHKGCNGRQTDNGDRTELQRRKLHQAPVTPEQPAPAIYDSLTGLYTHSFLHDHIVREFSRANRFNYPFSCLMLDIDHFRNINEKLGYGAGEELLKEAASLLFENCRLSDFVARYGGEEFAVLLPYESYKGAAEVAQRLRHLFSQHQFKSPALKDVRITVSIGVSSFPEDPIKQRGEILTFASQALLRAKANGRNCATHFKDIIPVFGEDLPAFKISEDKILEFQRRMTEISNTARRAYTDASKALILALETKDSFTAGHAANVAKYALQIAEMMGLTVDEAEVIQHAALLHDIGKICIPDEILMKPGRLTLQEFEAMKQHPYLGYKILKPIKFLQQEAVLVLHHHEWFNGEGYPCRLKGNEIPVGARIIAVVDSYDTIRTAGGRYKKTSTVESSVNELIACSSVQFDPEVVRVFIEVLKKRKELTTEDYNKARLEEILQAGPSARPQAA